MTERERRINNKNKMSNENQTPNNNNTNNIHTNYTNNPDNANANAILNFKLKELEDKNNKTIIEIKSKFSEIYKKFKEEMIKKIDLKDKKISKLNMKIDKLENEIRENKFTSNENHNKDKKEFEVVIFKQEEIIENLIKSKEELNAKIANKDKEINNLKIKLKEEEIKNKKYRIIDNTNYSSQNEKLSNLIGNKGIKARLTNIIEDNEHLNKDNTNEISMINKVNEVEYFRNLNKNLLEQIKGK